MLLLLPVLLSYYAIGLKDHMLPQSIQNVESTLGSPIGMQDNVKLMELSVFGLILTDNTHTGNLSCTDKHTSLQHQHVNKNTDGEVLTLTLLQT